MQFNLQKTLSR